MKVPSRVVLIICLLTSLVPFAAPAGPYVEPTARTNVNKQTDLFEKSIGDVKALEQELDNTRARAASDIAAGKGQEYLSDKPKSQVEAEAGRLGNINAGALEDQGRAKMLEDNVIEEVYVDETRPLNIAHKKDAERIAEASGKLLGNLLGQLKELGVDCRAVKGDKVVEPEYFIDIKKTETKDTRYDKKICEERRNKYNCRDSLTLNCVRTEMRWDPWEEREIEFSGPDIYWNRGGWIDSIKWKKRRFGMHMKTGATVMAEVRQAIATKLNVPLENIDHFIKIDPRGIGKILHLEHKSYVWEKFKFVYKYRRGELVCSQWQEDWTERCSLR